MDLADAINAAFARWDRSHLSQFTLGDGRVVTDEETGAELANSIGGPITQSIDMATVEVAQTLKPGEEFQFTFDFGDNWTHRCVVGDEKIDPLEVLGIRPDAPLPYWGCTGSREGWQDMEAFAGRQRDEALRERLERAIEGKGAFRRFRDAVYGAGFGEQWMGFSTDRQLGRAREFLADEGIRVG